MLVLDVAFGMRVAYQAGRLWGTLDFPPVRLLRVERAEAREVGGSA